MMLARYGWSGNVRELRNANERRKYVASTTLQRAAAVGQLDAAAG